MTTIEELEEENKVILRSDAYFDKYKKHKVCERCKKDFKTKNKGAKYCMACLALTRFTHNRNKEVNS